MRTIIINTLGRDLPKHDLFFLPFRDDQLFWLNKDMGGIGACAEEIEALYSSQDKRQDYRLMVLADLAGYDSVDKRHVQECCQNLLKAYLNDTLILPLAEERKLPPRNVTVVFLVTRKTLGTGKVQPERVLDHLLGLKEDQQDTARLELVRRLPGGAEEHLDVSGMFRKELDSYRAALADANDDQTRGSALKYFRQDVEGRVKQLQKCVYTPAGFTHKESLPLDTAEFFPQSTSRELIWADLQLNLSEFLAGQSGASRNGEAGLRLKAHTDEELAACFARASVRVRYLQTRAPGQRYYPMENQSNSGSEGLHDRIWTALLDQAELLPGVRQAKDYSEGKEEKTSGGLTGKLRRAWVRVGQEKKQFETLCQQLEDEYNASAAAKQQQTILDTCAREFRIWRGDVLRQELRLPLEPDATGMPALDTRELEEELRQAQAACSVLTAEKLEDYVDLRQQAEEVKAGYRKVSRFWAPDCGSANGKFFQLYSLVMAVLFLIQMLLPYVGITMGQSGVELSRYVYFLTSTAVFTALYMAGLLMWLRRLCRDIHKQSELMSQLINESSIRRRDSIAAVVRAYGEALPRCTILHEDLRELRRIHQINLARKERHAAHMALLRRAEELLRELDTQLRLPVPDVSWFSREEQVVKGIDYQLPPDDGRNIPYYMLLSDEWGDKSC